MGKRLQHGYVIRLISRKGGSRDAILAENFIPDLFLRTTDQRNFVRKFDDNVAVECYNNDNSCHFYSAVSNRQE